jgi:5'-3' exonuclease
MPQYLEKLVGMVRPSRLLFLALDGVLPEAKMGSERQRRFLAAHCEQIRREEAPKVCIRQPLPPKWPNVCINLSTLPHIPLPLHC